MRPLLLFHFDTNTSSNLIDGRLLLINKDTDEIIEIYRAASGSIGNQTFNHIGARGKGPIPPQNECGIKQYQVLTNPIFMPNVKGVEGNFFKINPHFVKVGSVQRGDFGIHSDANAPGSAGCVVLTTDVGWKAFQVQMKKLVQLGISQVPLLISYVR